MEPLTNVEYIVAIELLCAAQGIDFLGPEKLGKGTKAAYSATEEGAHAEGRQSDVKRFRNDGGTDPMWRTRGDCGKGASREDVA